MTASNIIRWIARIWSIGSAALLIPFLFSGGGIPTAYEALMMAFFPFGVLIGFAIAWRREGLGGAITVFSLVALYVLMFLRDGRLPAGPYFVLFAAPGFLFLLCWLLSARQPHLHARSA